MRTEGFDKKYKKKHESLLSDLYELKPIPHAKDQESRTFEDKNETSCI